MDPPNYCGDDSTVYCILKMNLPKSTFYYGIWCHLLQKRHYLGHLRGFFRTNRVPCIIWEKKKALIVFKKGLFSGTTSIILEKLQFSPPESLPILFWFSLYTVFFLRYQVGIRVFFWFYWIIGNIFFIYSWITGNISQIFYFTCRIFPYFISADHLHRIKILIRNILTLKYRSRLTEDV